MKKVSILLTALFLGLNGLSIAAPKSVKVNAGGSTVLWFAEKVTGKHNGTVGLKQGDLKVDGNKLVGGSFVIDLTSIVCKDLTDPNFNKKFITHITSGDFFEVEKFPTASFTITKVANQVSGNMTIKGITKAITFPAEITVNKGKVSAKADITLDRTDYNIKYGSKKFFESIGDKAIYDDFKLSIQLVSE